MDCHWPDTPVLLPDLRSPSVLLPNRKVLIGYFADYASGEIVVDGQEILDAHWFSSDGLPPVPPKLSIARRLIDAWVEDVAGGR